MKKFFNNKYILLGIALLTGIFLGWIMTGSQDKASETSHVHDVQESEVHSWTCSMHPQIRASEPGQCPICGMDLIPVRSGTSVADHDPMIHRMSPEAVALANIRTSTVTGMSAAGEIFLTGKVKMDERQVASIAARFPGRIEKLYVNFTGQEVKRGQLLATIYSPELITAQKELLMALTTKDSYPELYASAREKLRLWKLTDRQIDQIEKRGVVKDYFNILADKGGIVTNRFVAVGDYVSTGTPLFEVVDLSRVWIMIDAYETDLPFVNVGNKVLFSAAGVPDKTFEAKIIYIDPVIDPDTRTASIRAEAANTDGRLKPEMFVNARIKTTVDNKEASLAIPRTALLWTGKRSIVYVEVPDAEVPTYEMREISIGPRMGDMYLVEGGLEAGEEVVTNGAFTVDAAAQLSGDYSMLNRPESKTIVVSQPFREDITAVAEGYFEVKNALVNDDPVVVQNAAGRMQDILKNVEGNLLHGKAYDQWITLKSKLQNSAGKIAQSSTLDLQREHFITLSNAILEVTESFGLERDKVYKEFCPMASENKGAYWLSETEEIRNPYFGEAMLTCGEVVETYRKGQRVFENNSPARSGGGEHRH